MSNQEKFENGNWLNLELTDSQLFELERIKRDIPNMSRTKLHDLVIEAVKLRYKYQNAFKSILKKQL